MNNVQSNYVSPNIDFKIKPYVTITAYTEV